MRARAASEILNKDYQPNAQNDRSLMIERINKIVATRRAPYAFVPPSTVRLAPVMYEESGPATNATSAATSCTVP